ncbi:MAG: DMT family transporter [Bacillota bacterium]
MIKGIFFSLLAGLMIAFQSVFNTRLSDEIGFWHTNTLVHASGALLAFLVLIFISKDINYSKITNINPIFLIGGFLGVFIVFSVMQGVSGLGASYSLTLVITAQILATFIFNYFGLFGEKIINYSASKILGLFLMIIGLIIYQLR